MWNAFQKKIGLRVVVIHVALVLVLVVGSLLRGCFRPKPKEEIATFIEFGAPAPQVEVVPVSQLAEPEAPAPEPKPAPIPEPVKPKPKPKPKPRPKPKEPEKPKWKPVDPKKIKIGKKVNEQPVKPTISSAEIKKAMSGITSPSPRTTGNPSEFSAYDGQVFRIFYGAWARPGVPGLQPAKVRIFLLKNGRITKRTMIQGSGDPSFDQTVMAAVNSISTLPKPPAGYPDNFVVRFSIID